MRRVAGLLALIVLVLTATQARAAVQIAALAVPRSAAGESLAAPRPQTTPQAAQRIMTLGTRLSITLRTAPGAGAAVAAEVAGSEVMWATGRTADGQWVQVSYGEEGRQAWGAVRDLAVLGDVETLPVVSAAQAPAARPAPSQPSSANGQGPQLPATGSTVSVLANRLNVRSGPGTDQAIVGQLQAGATVTVQGHSADGEWIQIEWQQGTAWVAAQYVGSGSAASTTATRPAAQGQASTSSLTGKVAFQTRNGGDIYVVNVDGSGLRRVATGFDPAFSPDGNSLAYTRWGTPAEGVFIYDLRTGQESQLTGAKQPRSPVWSHDGSYLVFTNVLRSYTCTDTPFGCLTDEEAQRIFRGSDCIDTSFGRFCLSDYPVRTMEETGLVKYTLAGGPWLDVPAQVPAQSPTLRPNDGEILYRGPNGLEVTAPGEETRALVQNEPGIRSPVWSPDGQRIAVQMYLHDHNDLFVLDAAGNVQTRLTAPPPLARRPIQNVSPAWSPDGRHIIFLTDRDGAWRLYYMNADGSNQAPFLPEVLGDVELNYDFAAERMVTWGR